MLAQELCDGWVANFHGNVAILDDAAARIPSELIERMSLLGPADKIRHDLEACKDSFVTTLTIAGNHAVLHQAAEIVLD